MAKTVREIPKGMFAVTNPQTYKKDLAGWESFFKDKGIKTEILEDPDGKFVLCREGIEAHAD